MSLEFAPAPLPDDLVRRYRREGCQSDALLSDLLRRNATEMGRLPAVFDGEMTLNWSVLVSTAERFAGFLQSRGVHPGDVVTWQLPNWWESLVAAHGIWAAGAVSNPVVPIYRSHELRAVVEAVRPAVVMAPAHFRGCDHTDMIDQACSEVGWQPPTKVVLRGTATGWTTFEDTLRTLPHAEPDVDVDAPALIGFTSGTTSGAKGVVHSTKGILSWAARAARGTGYRWSDRSYMPATIAHATGLLWAVALPVVTGSSTVLRDHWDAERALDDIRHYEVTASAGAAVFMQEMLAALDGREATTIPLRTGYVCGGSSVPSALAWQAERAGMAPRRSFGMTECPTVAVSNPYDPPEIRLDTDGLVAPGCEVRVVDLETGRDLSTGHVGEFVVRGPQRALGYLDPRHTAESYDELGWFHTGDLGFTDDAGALTVTGRVKEIINRGGEKISGREIEEVLVGHSAVVAAAVVPAPHRRFGEQPAAFVRLQRGTVLTPSDLERFLHSSGLAPQKVPKLWRFVDELPCTPSGKVKKYVLQAQLGQQT